VRADHDTGRSADQRGTVLRRVTGCCDQADGGRKQEAASEPPLPFVGLLDRPVIVVMRVGRERRVERVVRMMVREHDVGDGAGRLA
jgi:hypothetical protein